MAQGALAFAVVMTLAALCSAADFDIGAWNLKREKVEYKAFATSNQFAPGDTLKFEFAAGAHSVYKLATQEAYDNCDLSKPVSTYTETNAVVKLNNLGKNFFVCGVGMHCVQGMKVTINVGGAEAPSPSAEPPQSGAAGFSSFFSTVCFGAVAAVLAFF